MRPQLVSNAANALFRSRIEIAGILQKMAHGNAVLSAEVGDGEQLFLTRVLHVDPQGEFFVVAYSQDKPLNSALLDEQSLVFHAHLGFLRIEFAVAYPSETMFNGSPAVRFAVPGMLMQTHRREHLRFKVPPHLSLRCIADCAGVASFEARIVDISRGGMGGMIHDPGIMLTPGTMLKGCRIITPGGNAIVADLEVRNTTSVTLPEGDMVSRTGVRFVGEPEGIDSLLGMFITEI